MKKLLPLLTVLFLLLTVTPIFAKSGNSSVAIGAHVEDEQDEDFRNHGEFVSSVAVTHPGGEVVSEAARSDVGKKGHDDDEDEDEDEFEEDDEDDNNASPTPSVSPLPSVSPSPSASPSPGVSPSPEASPTPDVSPSPSISPSPTPAENAQEQITFLQSIVDRLNSIIDTLKNLL